MNKLIQPKNGYTGLVWSNSFVSKSIQFFLKIWYIVTYQQKVPEHVPSHTFTIITVPEKLGLYVCEADVAGVQIVPFESSGYMNNQNVTYRRLKVAPTQKQLNKLSEVAHDFVRKITRYDFPNFIYQADMIIKKALGKKAKWVGPTGLKAQKRTYCSELTAYLDNAMVPTTWDKPWAVNPVDHMFNSKYEDVIN